ncbi:HPr kinase [Kordiimonas sediminis]|uniref:HPr kinase n=1 Tax=Kordiimonas sediminis TaxID=1735581 RepID=A0A919AN80_9PROT|nr:HPr kinase [Kordiimonas sediminis]
MEIVNKRGLHARASARLAREAGQCGAALFIEKDGTRVTATSIMGLMMLGAAKGDSITVIADGESADEAGQIIVDLVRDRFGEDE